MTKLHAILVEMDPVRSAAVRELLGIAGCEVVASFTDIQQLLTQPQRPTADLIAIAVAEPEPTLLNDLIAIQSARPSPVVLFSADEAPGTIQRAVQAGVSAYVVDGVNPVRVRSILEAAIARFRQFKALAEELHKTRSQLTERKLIERAKGIVMRQRGLAEDDAYKLMRKTAMDRNKRMAEIADSIISASDLLGSSQDQALHAMPAGAV